jgi:BirA family biotin operon repressor/biotin-[acetyl-CoA-carboxylase] ligase
MDKAREEIKRKTAQHGMVILAERQTAGRGSRGRHWESPAGNLHMTTILELSSALPSSGLAFMVGLAMFQVLRPWVSPRFALSLKWPNDVLVNDRKVGGMLVEREFDPSQKKDFVIVGVGLNIGHMPCDRVRFPTISLQKIGLYKSPRLCAQLLQKAIMENLHVYIKKGRQHIHTLWQRRAWCIDEPISFSTPSGKIFHGLFRGIGEDGELILEQNSGQQRCFRDGSILPSIAWT